MQADNTDIERLQSFLDSIDLPKSEIPLKVPSDLIPSAAMQARLKKTCKKMGIVVY